MQQLHDQLTVSGAGLPGGKASASKQDRKHEAHMQVANGCGMLTDVATISRRHKLPDSHASRTHQHLAVQVLLAAWMLQPKLDTDSIKGTMRMLEAEMKGF